jgi:predicted phage tail protein
LAADPEQQSIGAAVQEISERASLLIREEIELAKAEISEKVNKLIRGAVVGIAAGIFVVTALLFVLHGFAWLAWFELFSEGQFFWGFFVVAGVLLLLGGLAGWIAARAVKSGAPPTPEMAIEEAKLIRATVAGDEPPPAAIGGTTDGSAR